MLLLLESIWVFYAKITQQKFNDKKFDLTKM